LGGRLSLSLKTFKLANTVKPFFTAILSAGNPKLASIFVPKAAPSLQPGETILMYEKCGMRIKAAEEAVKIKDVETIDRLRNAAGVGTVEAREIERLGAGLKR
jgi:vacuolar protein sorting-associated protein 16